jgi:hypothetical protein
MKKFWSVLLTVAFTVLIAGGPSSARASILGDFYGFEEDVQIEDRDVERLIKGAGNVGGATLEVGDILEAVIRFDNISGSNIGLSDLDDFVGNSEYELLGYSRIRVASITANGDAKGSVAITFDSGFADGQTMVQLFESTAAGNVYNEAIAPAALIAAVTSQSLIASAGLVDADDFWVAPFAAPSVDATTLAAFNPGFGFALGLSVITADLDLKIANEALVTVNPLTGAVVTVDIVGSGNVKSRAPGVNTGWDASSDAVFQYHTVPEPASLAVWGMLATAGLGLSIARRRKA